MVDPDNIVLEHFRHIRGVVDGTRDDIRKLKHRVGSVEREVAHVHVKLAQVHVKVAELSGRVDRLSDRFEREEAPHPLFVPMFMGAMWVTILNPYGLIAWCVVASRRPKLFSDASLDAD